MHGDKAEQLYALDVGEVAQAGAEEEEELLAAKRGRFGQLTLEAAEPRLRLLAAAGRRAG